MNPALSVQGMHICKYVYMFIYTHTYTHTYTDIYLFYLDSWEREIKRDRNNFHLLVHSPNGYNCQNWASLEAASQEYLSVSHMGAGTKDWKQTYLSPKNPLCFSLDNFSRGGQWTETSTLPLLPVCPSHCPQSSLRITTRWFSYTIHLLA